jgi:RimJ/RimL family protein N-acetyltransferase
MAVTLRPFPETDIGLLWEWMHEYPDLNFDDGGPQTQQELAALLWSRIEDSESQWEVLADGQPVGFIGYRHISRRTGALRGIVFSRAVHGTGVARQALIQLLTKAFEDGADVVKAEFFSHNHRVQRFLEKLGGTIVDYIFCGSTQDGIPIDWKALEITAAAFKAATVRVPVH